MVILVHNFWSQGSIDTLAFFTDCTVWQIAVMFALFTYVCFLNDSIEDMTIKYAEAFSTQC